MTENQDLEANISLWNETIEEKINMGNLEGIDTTYAKDYIYHGMGQLRSIGTTSMKKEVAALRRGFSDIHITNDIFGFGDRAVNHFHITGTHDGEWKGIKATGKKICFSGIAIGRFVDGVLVEEWEFCDEITLLKQLGIDSVPVS